ncbi:phospholipase [Pseudomonas sp. A34-9]|uniref:phospholipase n=1 Tax=Pseudomonas sp. A34-9 TaxID=3034675 RepID=UPI00240DEDD3|nr:phospholipase [Pseudomonas sp. A34-9]
MNDLFLQNFGPHQWMGDTPQLDDLSLLEMTLPGTHNAGCDWEASFSLIPGPNWLACQDVPFYSQLNRGARVLDVRLMYDSKGLGFAKFRFQHDGYRSSRNLLDLVRDVVAFLQGNPDEFIILDFHELKKGDSDFNHEEFKQLILEHLGERMIPQSNIHLTLGQLKNISSRQRIVVAAPLPNPRDSLFHEQIPHKWIGEALVNASDLYRYIEKTLSNPPSQWRPWSLSATSYTVGGPQRILNELDIWFDPAKTEWAKKCNIINFDFIKNSNIVPFCRLANVQKANEKITVTASLRKV